MFYIQACMEGWAQVLSHLTCFMRETYVSLDIKWSDMNYNNAVKSKQSACNACVLTSAVSDGDEDGYGSRGGLSKRKKKKRRHRSVRARGIQWE